MGPPDPPGQDGDDRGEGELEPGDDDDGEEEPARPRRGVGADQDVARSGRPVDEVVDAVEDDRQPDDEGDDDGEQRRDPDEPAEPAVEGAGADEPPGRAGVLEAVDAGQPRPVLGGPGVGDARRAVDRVPRSDEDAPVTGRGHEVQVDGLGDLEPERVELGHDGRVGGDLRIPPTGQDEQAAVRPGGEAADRVGQLAVSVEGPPDEVGIERLVAAPAGEQVPADDDRPWALPPFERLGDVGRQRLGRRRALGRQQQVADDHDPTTERDVDPGGRGQVGRHRHLEGAQRLVDVDGEHDRPLSWHARRRDPSLLSQAGHSPFSAGCGGASRETGPSVRSVGRHQPGGGVMAIGGLVGRSPAGGGRSGARHAWALSSGGGTDRRRCTPGDDRSVGTGWRGGAFRLEHRHDAEHREPRPRQRLRSRERLCQRLRMLGRRVLRLGRHRVELDHRGADRAVERFGVVARAQPDRSVARRLRPLRRHVCHQLGLLGGRRRS